VPWTKITIGVNELKIFVKVYLPSKSVVVPVVDPLIVTFTPIKGSSSILDTTFPETLMFCPYNCVIKAKDKMNGKINLILK